MSRIINPDGAGKERSYLVRCIVLTVRELLRKKSPDAEARDMVAFLVLALQKIYAGIDISVAAWEKRGYWVKADRFRQDWSWSVSTAGKLLSHLQEENWKEIIQISIQIAQKLGTITIPPGHRLGAPWVGALKALRK